MAILYECNFVFVHENGTTRLPGGTDFPEKALPKMQEYAENSTIKARWVRCISFVGIPRKGVDAS